MENGSARLPGGGARGLLVLPVIFSLFMGACETCVGGKVSMEGVPLEGAYVVLLDEEGQPLEDREVWTDDQGGYCFDGIPFERDYTVQATYQGEETVVPFFTGTKGAKCGSIFCTEVNPTISCSVPDAREPNNACDTAAPVALPFFEPLGALCPPGDVDFYRVEVDQENMNLLAEVRSPPGGPYLYKRIGLFDSECDRLTSDSGSSSADITYALAEPGTYFVAVTHGNDYQFNGEHDEYGDYELEIQVVPSACVSFTVQENGMPLAGADIRNSDYPYDSCTTDGTGFCCLGAYAGLEKDVRVRHPLTYEYLYTSVTPSEPGSCEEGVCEQMSVDFNYTCVSGAVTRLGEPVIGADVDGPFGDQSTGLDGTYCLRAPRNQDVTVYIKDPVLCSRHPGVVGTGTEQGSCVEGECTALDFQLAGLTCVNLTVTRDGEPVEGVRVYLPYGCSQYKVSGPDGKICFPAPEESSFLINVRDPLFDTTDEYRVETDTGGSCDTGGCTEVEIPLTGVTCVSGIVQWQDGQPADDIRVRGPAGESRTEPDGSYCVEAPENTLDVRLRFSDPVHGQERTRYVNTGDTGSCPDGDCTPLDVVFPSTACISGILSREDGNPPTGMEACIGYGKAFCVDPDPEGSFCLRAPAQDDVRVYVYDNVTGHSEDRTIETGPAGSCGEGVCTQADFELPGVSCVSGTVIREGEVVEGAEVCLGYIGDFCVSSGPAGIYCLPAPLQSRVRVEVRDPLLGEKQSAYVYTGPSISCSEGNCFPLDFLLRGATCIDGIVREGDEPLVDAEVWNEFGRVFTNAEGRYCLPTLASDDRWIRCGHPLDGSEILRYPVTGVGGRCETGGCKNQNFTFDLKKRRP